MNIALGSDHAGFTTKEAIKKALEEDSHDILDVGTHSTESVDYPDYAKQVAQAVARGNADYGILICGSGSGMVIAANKVHGVRAAFALDRYGAEMARKDNDANILTLRERHFEKNKAIELARIFLSTKFTGAVRHKRRIKKVMDLEK